MAGDTIGKTSNIDRMIIVAIMGAAIGFALSQIFVRLGLNHGSPLTAVTFSILTMTPLMWLILGYSIVWESFSLAGVLWFMLSGAVAPLATQVLLFTSALRVGISRASPLRNTSPLFASLLAIAFLGERWTLPLAAGTMSIILGATLLGMDDGKQVLGFRKRYLWLSLASGFVGGFSDPMRKFGFSLMSNLPLAICSLMTGSLIVLLVYLVATGKHRDLVINRGTLQWFGLAGVASAVGISSNLVAVNMGKVVVVTPLMSTVPLFTIFLSLLFLQKLERVTGRVILGALSICAGAALISLTVDL